MAAHLRTQAPASAPSSRPSAGLPLPRQLFAPGSALAGAQETPAEKGARAWRGQEKESARRTQSGDAEHRGQQRALDASRGRHPARLGHAVQAPEAGRGLHTAPGAPEALRPGEGAAAEPAPPPPAPRPGRHAPPGRAAAGAPGRGGPRGAGQRPAQPGVGARAAGGRRPARPLFLPAGGQRAGPEPHSLAPR